MEISSAILEENKRYWTSRAPGYSEINRNELSNEQKQSWKKYLYDEISYHFPKRSPEELRVLDIGTGPGFLAILLCELGCNVTAIDLTPAMLSEAYKNAGAYADKICFLEMNAEATDFENDCYDMVVSRNLTWNLPHPDQAYKEWIRILKPGGLLLNFDANWYAYLFDCSKREAYDQDRINSAMLGITDRNIGEKFDIMEDIARRIPLSNVQRPIWDLEYLKANTNYCGADETIWQNVWSDEEKVNFASTPMFMIRAVK